MSREWKPGDVGLVPGVGVAVMSDQGWLSPLHPGQASPARDYLGIRPLVVIDPEDREQVEMLIDAYVDAMQADGRSGDTRGAILKMQAALRSLIAEPEPDEPAGLGAVVETSIGRAVRNGFGPGSEWVDPNGVWRPWSDLPRPITVLSPGWQEEAEDVF